MSIGEMIGIGALILNIITLIIVIYQTRLSREGFQLSKTSFDKDKRIREMSIVPKMHYVIYVQIQIEKWIDRIKVVKEEMELALKDGNNRALEHVASQGLKTCKGIVNKFYYENSPDWLSEIYMTGAKYYYYVFAPICELWDYNGNEGRMFLLEEKGDSLIDRCDESEFHLRKLLEYIDDSVPSIFTEAPDSIPDDKFLSDN